MIRHEMLAFYKALYSVCLKPYASKLPTAFIQKESPSFVWCISCLISENNVLMHQCAISANDINLHFELWGLRFELYDYIQCYFSRLFGRTDCVDCVHSVSDLRFNVQYSIFNSEAPADAIFPRRSFWTLW